MIETKFEITADMSPEDKEDNIKLIAIILAKHLSNDISLQPGIYTMKMELEFNDNEDKAGT